MVPEPIEPTGVRHIDDYYTSERVPSSGVSISTSRIRVLDMIVEESVGERNVTVDEIGGAGIMLVDEVIQLRERLNAILIKRSVDDLWRESSSTVRHFDRPLRRNFAVRPDSPRRSRSRTRSPFYSDVSDSESDAENVSQLSNQRTNLSGIRSPSHSPPPLNASAPMVFTPVSSDSDSDSDSI